MERASGVRQTTCPWQAMRDPFTVAVIRAHRWFKEEQLAVRYPNPPEALMRGIEIYDAALQRVLGHDFEARQKSLEQDNERRLSEFGAPALDRPLVRRR